MFMKTGMKRWLMLMRKIHSLLVAFLIARRRRTAPRRRAAVL